MLRVGRAGSASAVTVSAAPSQLSVAAPAGRVLGQPFARAAQDRLEIDEGESVNFDGSESLIGRFVDVVISEALPNSLRGRLADSQAAA